MGMTDNKINMVRVESSLTWGIINFEKPPPRGTCKRYIEKLIFPKNRKILGLFFIRNKTIVANKIARITPSLNSVKHKPIISMFIKTYEYLLIKFSFSWNIVIPTINTGKYWKIKLP